MGCFGVGGEEGMSAVRSRPLAGAGLLRLLCLRQLGPAQPCRSLLPQCRKDALCASSVMSLQMPLCRSIFP